MRVFHLARKANIKISKLWVSVGGTMTANDVEPDRILTENVQRILDYYCEK